MIIYYQKSTKEILSIINHHAKDHLKTQEELEAELDDMFPNLIDDVGVSRPEEEDEEGEKTEKKVEAQCGGTWDDKKQEQSAPPSTPEPSPDADRIAELKTKFETGSASLAEVQEYLYKTR